MRHAFLLVALFLSTTLLSQERREYEVINDNTVEVKVYNQQVLTQKGLMVKFGERWRTNGEWVQYDESGRETLRVLYKEGRRVWVHKDFGSKSIVLVSNLDEQASIPTMRDALRSLDDR